MSVAYPPSSVVAHAIIQCILDFCSRHSFDKLPVAVRHGYSNGAGVFGGESSERPAKRPVRELTEEEQLQAAIRASMQPDGGGDDTIGEDTTKDVDNDDDVEVVETWEERKTEMDDPNSKPSSSNKFEEEILTMKVGDEPSSGESSARVQIRMPDGKRLVRKFRGEDTVKIIYAFVAVRSSCVCEFIMFIPIVSFIFVFCRPEQQSNEEARGGRPFELKAKFPPQDLFPFIDNSVSSCGLSGEAINVIWK